MYLECCSKSNLVRDVIDDHDVEDEADDKDVTDLLILLRERENRTKTRGFGRRLMFERLWVRIRALYTGWT